MQSAPERGRFGWPDRRPSIGWPFGALARAAVLVLLPCCAAGFWLGQAHAFQPSAELAALAGDPWAAKLSVSPDGTAIRVEGALGEGVAVRLGRLLDDHPGVRVVSLTSEGGYVEEAEAIGRQIAARRLATYVPDYCISVCTLAFARGGERLIGRAAQLGFHAPYETGPDSRMTEVDSTDERRAYVAAGVAPDFVAQALAVPPRDIWFPEPARLIAARIASRVIDTTEAIPVPEAWLSR